jgi:hypothetical protein
MAGTGNSIDGRTAPASISDMTMYRRLGRRCTQQMVCVHHRLLSVGGVATRQNSTNCLLLHTVRPALGDMTRGKPHICLSVTCPHNEEGPQADHHTQCRTRITHNPDLSSEQPKPRPHNNKAITSQPNPCPTGPGQHSGHLGSQTLSANPLPSNQHEPASLSLRAAHILP